MNIKTTCLIISFVVIASLGSVRGQDSIPSELPVPPEQQAYTPPEIEVVSSFSASKDGGYIEKKKVKYYVADANGKTKRLSFILWEQKAELVDGKFPQQYFEFENNKEVELVESQKNEMAEIRNSYLDQMKTLIEAELEKNGGDVEAIQRMELIDRLKELHEQQTAATDDVLLPTQKALLKQLRLLRKLEANTMTALNSANLKLELGLSEEQLQQLKKIEEDSKKEVVNIKKRAQERVEMETKILKSEIMKIMTQDQKRQLTEMLNPDK